MAAPIISGLDHLVLTVDSIDETCAFYMRVLGCKEVQFGRGRRGLSCGSLQINLHQREQAVEPRAAVPAPGSADLCFVSVEDLDRVARHLDAQHIPVILGPVARTGANGTMHSLYFRDPDGNLIEIGHYAPEHQAWATASPETHGPTAHHAGPEH